eukprot:jgi/Astpho2/6062/Aster-04011
MDDEEDPIGAEEDLEPGSGYEAEPAGSSPARLQNKQDMEVLGDLLREGQQVTVAKGGRGGKGNASMRHNKPNRPAVAVAEPGSPGERQVLVLEIKTIADVGLVADYPFTTLHPQLGTVAYSDGTSLTVADIPGVLPGASNNRGLGHAFLRHIERSAAIAYVVSLSGVHVGKEDSETSVMFNPLQQLQQLQRELHLYEPNLLTRPSLIVATQADRLSPDKLKAAVSTLNGSSKSLSVHVVSGMHQWGIRELHLALHAVCPPRQAQTV